MKQDDGVTRVPDPGVCAFWIKKKKSFCRWPPLNGGKYCRHHVEGRVPCPINPNHFIPADEVDQHVLRCPSITQQRESQEQPHFCKGVNRPRKGAPPAITAAAAAVAAATAPATITNGGDRGAGAGREARAGSQADTTAPRDTGRAPSSAITDVTSGQQGEAPRAACGQLASDRGPDSRPGKRCIAAAANNNDNRGTGAAANALGAGAAPDDARKHKAAIRQLATSLSQEQLSALLDKVGQACRMLRCDEERHPLRCSVLRPAVAEEVMLSEGGSDEPHKFALSRRHTIQQASILGNLLEFGIVRGASITHGSDANPPAGAVQEPGRCDGNAVDDQIAHVEKNGQQAVHATVGSGHQTPPMTLAAHHGEGTGASHADIGGGRDAMNDVMYIQDAPVIATGSPRSQSGDAACPQPQHLSRDAACPQPQHLPRDAACPQPQHLPLKGGSACPSRPRAEGKGREQQDGWVPPPPVLVEFGAGKGYLSLCLSMCLGLRDVVLVDRGTFRNKADRVLRTEKANPVRLRIDIADLELAGLPLMAGRAFVGHSKHLCGPATDLTLQCCSRYLPSSCPPPGDDGHGRASHVTTPGDGEAHDMIAIGHDRLMTANSSAGRSTAEVMTPGTGDVRDGPGTANGTGDAGHATAGLTSREAPEGRPVLAGFAIATCCHHLLSWDTYINTELFTQLGFSCDEFHLVVWMTSWGVCGDADGKARAWEEKKAKERNMHSPAREMHNVTPRGQATMPKISCSRRHPPSYPALMPPYPTSSVLR
eukprot:jgi/Mesvir1/20288/Mv19896-RA.2